MGETKEVSPIEEKISKARLGWNESLKNHENTKVIHTFYLYIVT